MFRLFVYGSLMDPELVRRLLGRDVRALPARLKGYRKVEGAEYPTAVRDEGAYIDGLVLEGLSEVDLRKLD